MLEGFEFIVVEIKGLRREGEWRNKECRRVVGHKRIIEVPVEEIVSVVLERGIHNEIERRAKMVPKRHHIRVVSSVLLGQFRM